MEGTSRGMAKKKVAFVNPLDVTESLGFQTFRRDSRRTWTKDEDKKVTRIMLQMYPDVDSIDPEKVRWDLIAKQISPNGIRKPKDCRKRWTNSLSPNLRKGKWTKEEDEELIKAYNKYGSLWQRVAQDIQGRTDDQCAKRYLEVLDPNTKDRLKPWSHEEDVRLIRQIRIHGTKWRTIAATFSSRPSLTCRNRWRKLVTEVARGKADDIIKKEVDLVTAGKVDEVEIKQEEKETSLLSQNSQNPQNSHNSHNSQNSQNSQNSHSTHNNPARIVQAYPVNSEIEWRYSLDAASGNADANLPHNKLFDENGGLIKDQDSVSQLIVYAKAHGLEINVHQHIHHHYSPPTDSQMVNSTSPLSMLDQANAAENISGSNSNTSGPSPPGDASRNHTAFYLEPETQLQRYQHFNYLPPLTEVPKLNSSSSSPSASATHHHHHHHHHHHLTKNSSKMRETDLLRILNQGSEPKGNNPLTPLSQAVEIAAATDNKRSHQPDSVDQSKRQKHQSEDEEGPDFWETMRDLDMTQSRNEKYKPVSQHHPAHLYASGTTPQPEPNPQQNNQNGNSINEDEIDEEVLNSFGLFYNVYTRQGSVLPEGNPQPQPQSSSYDAWGGGFGIIPFNPS